MRQTQTFVVIPSLPPRLSFLRELAYNLWWCWNHDAIDLLRRIDRPLWQEIGMNPVKLLGTTPQRRLEELAQDDGFLAHLDRVENSFRRYMSGSHWYSRTRARMMKDPEYKIAYFSLEYGLTESVPIYSGGLGVLAGDHLKSCSDLGIPLIGVGLLYLRGYFRQYLNADGWQQEIYPETDVYNLPLVPALDAEGKQVRVEINLGDRILHARTWRIEVGRLPLLLLDTNVPENLPHDREVTASLYGGGADVRIRQEILLGIGGLRALKALGIEPTVCHMNEGHSAFLALEQIRQEMKQHGLTFDEAAEVVSTANVFTTHTPVPAGNERFTADLIERYLHSLHEELGLSCQDFLALGRENPHDPQETFCLTVLALRLADHSNGVSRLHGEVSRKMWARVWPEIPADEVPIHSITNGVHTRTWISNDLAYLFDTYLGHRWGDDPANPEVWDAVDTIPDEELWRTHTYRRERLVAFTRRRLKEQLRRRGLPEKEAAVADEVLDPAALTIGFARRFATYKRANLILQNLDRTRKILLDKDRPVQLIFAGKAHPADNQGKELIRQIIHIARDPELRRRIVFLEDYDMRVARVLVQGVDVWLNNPMRPKEASGTSGMKAAANGAINMSVLDGWWVEGFSPDHGWAIGQGEEYADTREQDVVESANLLDLLEQEVIPTFYDRGRDRGSDKLPRHWIRRMKETIRQVVPVFNTNRMVAEYTDLCYLPAAHRSSVLRVEENGQARQLAAWKQRIRLAWHGVRVANMTPLSATELPVGQEFLVQADVHLNGLTPDDLLVELYHGPTDAWGNIQQGHPASMTYQSSDPAGIARFSGGIRCQMTGRHGYTVRILPRHEHLSNPYELFLIRWA